MAKEAVLKLRIKGKNYTFREASEKFKVPQSILRMRHYKGKRGLDLIAPVHTKNQKVRFKHLHGTVAELASQIGVDYSAMSTAVRVYNLA